MLVILLGLLIAVPLAELYVIVAVADWIGLLETIVVLVAVSIAGSFLLRREGTAAWRRLQEALGRGEIPTKEVTDGFLILLGGALLLTPGFLTDIVGLALVLPPSRAVVKRIARSVIFTRLVRRSPAGGAGVRTVRVVRERRRSASEGPGSSSEPEHPSSRPLPREAAREDGDDSRDTA